MTLKSGLGVTQGHWKYHPSIERIRLPIDVLCSISCRFWDIQCRKMSCPWNRGQRSLMVIETDTYRSANYDFLLTFHSNHGPISHRFRGRRRFQSRIANFSHPVYFAPPLNGLPWELSIGARGQNVESWGYRVEKEVWRCLQPCGYNTPTWRTDGQTDGRTDGHRATAKTALSHSVER